MQRLTSPAFESYPRAILARWFLLALLAGIVNAGGYLACHRFVTHVTGFGTLFGIGLAGDDLLTGLGVASGPLFFILGAALAAFLIDPAAVTGNPWRQRVVLSLVALLLSLAAAGGQLGLLGDPFDPAADYLLLALLCGASGLLNAAITLASAASLRATHLTGLATDLGIGLARIAFTARDASTRRVESRRNRLRLAAIGCFALGSGLGALVFMRFGFGTFFVPALLALLAAALVRPARHRPRDTHLARAAVVLLALFLARPPHALAFETKQIGPLGLTWGTSPKKAKPILEKRLKLLEEGPAKEAGCKTVDQRWQGDFAKVPTTEILLRYYDKKLFYAAVSLVAADSGAAVRSFEDIIAKMSQYYGPPHHRTKPVQMSSDYAILENIPLENRDWVLPMLWSESQLPDQQRLDALKELQIRVGLWDPFAGWKFKNDVTVQAFIFQDAAPAGVAQKILRPMWVFAKKDTMKKWKAETCVVKPVKIVEPRDF